MRAVLLGNAGAGKTTLSLALIEHTGAARLSLDELAFDGSAERRPLADSIVDALAFIGAHPDWIVEGCYADIIEPLLPQTELLVFLNPGVAVCERHCRARPFEAEKFESAAQQDANLANLLAWVAAYETRDDEYGLARHRRLFDGFAGPKLEFTRVEPDALQRVLDAVPTAA